MFSLDSIIILPAILAYISILIQMDDYIDRQIETTYFINHLTNLLKEVEKGVHNEI